MTAAEMTTEEFRRQWARTIGEEAFQSQVIDLARALGWRVAHFRPTRIQRKDGSVRYATPVQADGTGFPDLVLCNGRRVVFAELKSARGKVSPEQGAWLLGLGDAGQEAFLWRPADWDAIEAVLSGMAHQKTEGRTS